MAITTCRHGLPRISRCSFKSGRASGAPQTMRPCFQCAARRSSTRRSLATSWDKTCGSSSTGFDERSRKSVFRNPPTKSGFPARRVQAKTAVGELQLGFPHAAPRRLVTHMIARFLPFVLVHLFVRTWMFRRSCHRTFDRPIRRKPNPNQFWRDTVITARPSTKGLARRQRSCPAWPRLTSRRRPRVGDRAEVHRAGRRPAAWFLVPGSGAIVSTSSQGRSATCHRLLGHGNGERQQLDSSDEVLSTRR